MREPIRTGCHKAVLSNKWSVVQKPRYVAPVQPLYLGTPQMYVIVRWLYRVSQFYAEMSYRVYLIGLMNSADLLVNRLHKFRNFIDALGKLNAQKITKVQNRLVGCSSLFPLISIPGDVELWFATVMWDRRDSHCCHSGLNLSAVPEYLFVFSFPLNSRSTARDIGDGVETTAWSDSW